uniref:ATP-binding cassette domain-containing protein n=1 Tax=Enterobacter hormaechei TaxID=158836 RepID=UPI0023EC04DE
SGWAMVVQDREDAVPLQVTRGGVHFRDIHFHYGKKGGVIAGLDLVVKPGEKIGLVGPSGAGKSTLVNVLLRLYDLESGRILIDDVRPENALYAGQRTERTWRFAEGALLDADADAMSLPDSSGRLRGQVRAGGRIEI